MNLSNNCCTGAVSVTVDRDPFVAAVEHRKELGEAGGVVLVADSVDDRTALSPVSRPIVRGMLSSVGSLYVVFGLDPSRRHARFP